MHRKAFIAGLGGISVASLAAVGSTGSVKFHTVVPLAVQAAATTSSAPPPAAPTPYYPVPSAIGSSIARWNNLRQTDNLPFSSYASFLVAHRGWPGEAAMRRTAEKAVDPNTAAPAEVIAFFQVHPPLTATGQAKLAFALLASGRVEEARTAARKAWQGGALPRTDEDRLLSTFGAAFGPQDHDQRIDTLLGNGDTQSAQRALSFASPARRPIFEARLALQTKAADAATRFTMLGPVDGDPGLLMDRANWLRNSGQSVLARQLLATRRPLTRPPASAETWFETLLVMARGAANDRQWSTAYQIASQLDDAYVAGTDVSDRPFGERDEYTSLAWLAGTTALQQLGRPADAARMFDLYARAARSPQTRSKGFYWAAKAAGAAGQAQQASAYFEQAAASPISFTASWRSNGSAGQFRHLSGFRLQLRPNARLSARDRWPRR